MCVCVGYVNMSAVAMETRRGHQNPQGTEHGCGELNSFPLQESLGYTFNY